MNSPISSKFTPCASRAWLDVIDRVAKRALGPDDRTGAALAQDVQRLSQAYTRERDGQAWTQVPRGKKALAARLRFFFVRDWMKVGLPIAELVRQGHFANTRSIRVLDLGAGLGATTLGAAFALKELGAIDSMNVLATDDDREPLELMRTLCDEATQNAETSQNLPQITLETRVTSFFSALTKNTAPFDLIIAGFVWNEIKERADVDSLVSLIEKNLTPNGAFIMLEPALFETTQALEALRDTFVASSRFSALAPCTHDAPCPMRPSEHDWCHANLPFALPSELADVARDAGLRYERLSFSYFAIGGKRTRLETTTRVVSDALSSKGKTEMLVCGPGGLTRHRLLDRERSPENSAFLESERGDQWTLSSPDARVRPDVHVTRLVRPWPQSDKKSS